MLMLAQERLPSVPAVDLARIRALYDDGFCFRAFEVASRFRDLSQWRGRDELLLAGRLAPHLGAPRLGMALHHRAWRADPTDPSACVCHAWNLLAQRGPLEVWRFLKSVGSLDEAPDLIRSDWLATHAATLARLRDFDAAESWLVRAEEIAPGRAWLLVARADLYEQEDRYDDALTAARQSLEIEPWCRSGIQSVAHLLELHDRQPEAIELLAAASERIESALLLAQQGTLEDDLGRHADARGTWERFASRAPLIERRMRCWLLGRRSDAAYGCGEISTAAALAKESGDPFFLAIAARLESSEIGSRRALLEVDFVRQHHKTCAPATLAAIARYWGKEADHLEVADAICYDGTPNHRERAWAERNGFVTAEFTVTWKTAIALLDRGVPFTVATVETQSAHLQAVIGYDEKRGTLLIRDPTLPADRQMLAEPFLARYRSVGPRGMALVPRDHAQLLDGLELPDAPHYNGFYALQIALEEHDRGQAALEHSSLERAARGHRLELMARHALAHYDSDPAGMLRAVEELLGLYPDDTNLRLAQLALLRDSGRRDARLACYRELCGKPGADPILRREYARELQVDARELSATISLIDRVLRVRPLDARSIWLLAEARWGQRQWNEALELYRFAACLDDKDEALARSFWIAARHLHREQEALRFLRDRFRRFIARSAAPARTLFWAFSELERRLEAFRVLEEAVRARPDDGELLLFLAQSYAGSGEFEKAHELLDGARGLCRSGDWVRTEAQLASMRGDLAGALELWQNVLEAEPWAFDANSAVARLLADTTGRAAALDQLARACERFPYNIPLHQTRIEWLRNEEPAVAELAVRKLLEMQPADAWGQRELAVSLSRQGRHDESLKAMKLASELDPTSASEAHIRGYLLRRAGDRELARQAFREAIARSADDEYAISGLIECCDHPADRVEAVRYIERELTSQVILGDGLLAFAEAARDVLEGDELLNTLRKALEVRPDLWHSWSALIAELSHLNHLDEAVELAERAAGLFPLLPRIWLDLAAVRRCRQERPLEIEAIRRALRISPSWGNASRQLYRALKNENRLEEARSVLEQAIGHSPLDVSNYGCLAEALWLAGEKEHAIERLVQALKLQPDYDWAWDTLRAWAHTMGRPSAPVELARVFAETRAGDPAVFLRLAITLCEPAEAAERLAALERTITLDPRRWQAYDLKAETLAQAGRWDEAGDACRPAICGDQAPLRLRGRAAWILAERGDAAWAMARMQDVLADDPDYYWGWQNLANWTCNHGTPVDYLEAAEAMVRLAPDDATAAAYRGHARMKSGDVPGARVDFRRALLQAPDYAYAAFKLFDLELENNELTAAALALPALKTQHPGAETGAREALLALACKDLFTAQGALSKLCTAPSALPEWLFERVVKAFIDRGFAREAERVFARALAHSDVHPLVNRFRDLCGRARRFSRVKRMLRSLWTVLSRKDVSQPRRL